MPGPSEPYDEERSGKAPTVLTVRRRRRSSPRIRWVGQRPDVPVLPLPVVEPGAALLPLLIPVLPLPPRVVSLLPELPVPPLAVPELAPVPPELLPPPAIPLVPPVPAVPLELEFPVVELALPEVPAPLPLLLAPELGRAASLVVSCRPHAVDERARATPNTIQCLLMGEFLMVTCRLSDWRCAGSHWMFLATAVPQTAKHKRV
jgi:hypothetical protein